MAGRDEMETRKCCVEPQCVVCLGSGRVPRNGGGYLWADGFWHKTCPPSAEPIVVKPNGHAPVQPATLGTETPKREVAESFPRKPVPKKFKHDARTALREHAFALAVSASHVIYRGGTTAPQLLQDAEYIARWIADTPKEKP